MVSMLPEQSRPRWITEAGGGTEAPPPTPVAEAVDGAKARDGADCEAEKPVCIPLALTPISSVAVVVPARPSSPFGAVLDGHEAGEGVADGSACAGVPTGTASAGPGAGAGVS